MRTRCGLAMVVVLLACWGGAAVAASGQPPAGTLTAAEYGSLGGMISSLSAAGRAKPTNWPAMQRVCMLGRTSTALLVSVRSACEADVRFLGSIGTFAAGIARCGHAMPHKLVCEAELYNTLARDSSAAYAADAAAHTAATNRGFSGTCLAVIATTAAQLRLEKQLTGATKTLAADLSALARVAEGHPMPGVTQTKVDSDAAAFERILQALLASPSASNIRACPHQ